MSTVENLQVQHNLKIHMLYPSSLQAFKCPSTKRVENVGLKNRKGSVTVGITKL